MAGDKRDLIYSLHYVSIILRHHIRVVSVLSCVALCLSNTLNVRNNKSVQNKTHVASVLAVSAVSQSVSYPHPLSLATLLIRPVCLHMSQKLKQIGEGSVAF